MGTTREEKRRSAAPGSGGLSAEEGLARARAVADLVPHVVHRLTNTLMVQLGTTELMSSVELDPLRRRQLDDLAREARSAYEHLRWLGAFALADEPDVGAIDLRDVLRGFELLFTPFAKAACHELVVRIPDGSAVIRGDACRVLHLLVELALDTLGGPARRDALAQRGPGVLRVSLAARRGGSALRLSRTSAKGAVLGAQTDAPASAERIARDHGARLGRRRLRSGALGARLVFPELAARASDPSGLGLQAGAATPSVAVRPTGNGGRPSVRPGVLVAEGDPLLCGLLVDVLGQAGYAVRAVESPAAVQTALSERSWDLLLCDRDLLGDELPLEAERVVEGSPRVALMAGARPGAAGLPVLMKPFRPGELLDFVAGLVSTAPRDALATQA